MNRSCFLSIGAVLVVTLLLCACAKTHRPSPIGPRRDAATPVKELMKEAQVAYVEGRYPEATRMCKRVLMKEPDHDGALSIMGASHCIQKSQKGARRAYRKLRKWRDDLRRICEDNGIQLD